MVHACADPARCPNPEGLCGCGCGDPTRIARTTGRGRHRGCPTRYLHGHHCRKSPQDYEVDPGTGCWLWLLATTPLGYGVQRRGGEPVYAHRAAYEERHGPIPAGLELDHTCKRPSCVNPKHLEAVTHAVNVQRGRAAKLNPEDVAQIRDLAGSRTVADLAKSFRVSPKTIRSIVNDQAWKNGPEHSPRPASPRSGRANQQRHHAATGAKRLHLGRMPVSRIVPFRFGRCLDDGVSRFGAVAHGRPLPCPDDENGIARVAAVP